NLVMSPVFAQQQPDAAKRILVAYLRGQRDYYRTFMKNEGGREEFDATLMKYTPIQEPRLFTRMATHDIDPNGAMDPTVMYEMQDYFVKYGTQPQRVDLSKVIDGSYAEYAVTRIGRVNPCPPATRPRGRLPDTVGGIIRRVPARSAPARQCNLSQRELLGRRAKSRM